MKISNKINLDNRLYLCAKNVRKGKFIVDVGTDHAYLAIWLVLNKLIPYAIAADLRKGPLLNAKKNITKYNVEDKVETRLSDGLNSIYANEVDDIVIAGMGGELIIKIISNAAWLKNKSKHLILQPMSSEQELREFLIREGFKIASEQAVVSFHKVYTVMSVFFEENFDKFDKLYPYIGRLRENFNNEARLYIQKTIRDLKNKLKGYISVGKFEKIKDLQDIIINLEEIVKGGT